ncbi:MAG TPA: DUF4861 family protein [Bacteroidales bacterium]|nr:DUF4861 family protein [Bacteroidales bacterium]
MNKIIPILSLVFILFGCSNNERIKVTVSNPLATDRSAETVELLVSDLAAAMTNFDPSAVIITDEKGTEVPSQLIYAGEAEPVSLIFQPAVAANTESVYYVSKGTAQKYEPRAFGRFVPERMDDYAWENDRIAFRIYGTALIEKDGPSNGLDVWVKRTDKMVIDRWYADYLAGRNTYHDDNGEGCDCYKVGRTLGAGALAPWVNDSLWLGINFESHQTLDNGPLRTSFRLSYPPFLVNGTMVTETRIISLDAGSQLTKIVEEYTGMETDFPVAAGIVKRDEGMSLDMPSGEPAIAYRLDGGEGGITYVGTVLTTPSTGKVETDDHILILTTFTLGQKLTYYTGAGWSKWGFETDQSWTDYLSEYHLKLQDPLKVTVD